MWSDLRDRTRNVRSCALLKEAGRYLITALPDNLFGRRN
jgi:hypothetical protein